MKCGEKEEKNGLQLWRLGHGGGDAKESEVGEVVSLCCAVAEDEVVALLYLQCVLS